MKSSTKWIIGVVGLVICFYLGWFFPLLWLIWLIGVVILFATPTKSEASARPLTPPVATQPVVSGHVVTRLEAMIRDEQDEKIKQGLRKALGVVNESRPSVYDSSVAAAAVQQRPVQTEAERAEQKQRQELRNINTILYTASFLLVGAAALFIGFSTLASPSFKFVTLLLATFGFYAIGLYLYERSHKLKPAATAFVGTGLALIPFVGLAFNSFIVRDPALSWFLTSLLGLVAFLFAVSRIRSTVMAYLTLAFTFSLATSTVSVLDAPYLWYFVSIIVTASLLSYIAFKLPGRVPGYLKKPL